MTNKELQEELKKYHDDLLIFFDAGKGWAQEAEHVVAGEGKEEEILFIA